VLADGIEGRPQEVEIADTWNLDRVLEGQKNALAGAVLGDHRQQIVAAIGHFAGGNRVGVAAGQHLGQGALARAVRPHDGVDLAGVDLQVDAPQNLVAAHVCV
jgi:hypothetical protein